jgi:hypothetical protein
MAQNTKQLIKGQFQNMDIVRMLQMFACTVCKDKFDDLLAGTVKESQTKGKGFLWFLFNDKNHLIDAIIGDTPFSPLYVPWIAARFTDRMEVPVQQYKERDPEKYLTFFVGIRKPAAAQGEEGPQQDVDSGDFVVYSMTKGDVTTMVQNIMLFKPNSTTKK